MQRLRLGPHPGQWYILSPRTGVLQSRLWLLMLTGALTAGLAFIVTHVKSEPEPVQAAPNAQVSYTFSVVVSNNASREARIEISGAGSDVGDFRICIGSGSDQECRRLGRTSADYRTTIATTHGNTVPISAQVYECSDEECFSSFLSGSPRTVNATFTPHISSFSADDSSIDCDESTTIRWSLTNSNNFRVEQDAGDNNLRRTLVSRTINVFVNSSVGFTPRAVDCGRNVSISLNANGNSPGDSSQITIRVAVPRPPSIDSFSASDRSPAHDQDIRLTWTTSDAASASVRRCASGSTSFSSCTPLSTSLDGSVSDGPNSSSFIDPGETWYYEARAWNGTRGDCSDANTACSSRIAVTWGVAALDLFLTASNRTPAANQSVTLNWGLNSGETTNLDFVLEATIGNSAVYSGTSSSGSTTISGRSGGTVMRATFEAYVAGADPLTATPVDSAAVSVRWLAPVSVVIYASDETPPVGTAVRVQWRSLGVTEVEVTGPGINRTNLNCEGSCYVELSGRNDGGNVTITITGYLGDDPREAVATDSVTIDWDDPALTATLTASDTTPPANGNVTVTWNTSGAARVVVSGAISSTLLDGSLVLGGRVGGSVATITLQAYRTVGQANPDLTRTVTIRWQAGNTATNTPVGRGGATDTPVDQFTIEATCSQGNLIISWPSVAGATSYDAWIRDLTELAGSANANVTMRTTGLSATFSNLSQYGYTNGNTVTVQAAANNGAVRITSVVSDNCTVTGQTVATPTPTPTSVPSPFTATNLRVTCNYPDVTISWDAYEGSFDNYRVRYRRYNLDDYIIHNGVLPTGYYPGQSRLNGDF